MPYFYVWKKKIKVFWALCLNAVMYTEEYTKIKKAHTISENVQNVCDKLK